MKWIAVVAALSVAAFVGGCRRELAPGETRCVTNYGVTKCRTGQAHQSPGFWCTSTTKSDGSEFGLCVREPAQCENFRTGQSRYAPCAFQQRAICANTTCYVDPASCVFIEHNSGRDGNACVAAD